MKKSTRHKLIWKKTHGRCAHCGKYPPYEFQTIDHFVPLSVGGTFDHRNLVPLCLSCNAERKSTKINPWKFYRYAPDGVKHKCWQYYQDLIWKHRSMDGYIHGPKGLNEYVKSKGETKK